MSEMEMKVLLNGNYSDKARATRDHLMDRVHQWCDLLPDQFKTLTGSIICDDYQ